MSDLMNFTFKNNQVRVFNLEGEPWFIAKDVCSVLELKNVSDSISTLDEDEKFSLSYDQILALTDNPDVTRLLAINESGLYALIFKSRKPEAKKFRKWVTSEVLPQIHCKSADQAQQTIPQDYASALRVAADAWEKKQLAETRAEEAEEESEVTQNLLDEAENTLDAYRAILSPESCLDIGQVARGLAIPGLGRNKLFDYLRNKNFLQKKPSAIPYQTRIDSEHAVVETVTVNIGGKPKIKQKAKLTFRGLEWLVKKLTKDGYNVQTDARALWDYYHS